MDIQIQEALVVLLALSFIIQVVYLLFLQNKLNGHRLSAEVPPVNIPVSVIISARNEAENLSKYLPNFLIQQYPQYEVVVVNDCSTDDSEHVLEQMQQQYPHLKIVVVTESRMFKTGKKYAVTMGIKAAKYPHLLFTDADCQPASGHWISRMAAHFENPDTQIVLGYSPYYKTGGFLNSLIRYETIKTAINYLSAALRGNAYMGVGRNMGYRKELFFEAKGFASHMHVMSGDDDLFVNQNATKANTAIEINPDAFTFSEPKTTFFSWFRQKSRHMGAGKLYKARHKRMLGIEGLSGFLFYCLFFACLAVGRPALDVACALFVLRWLIQLLVWQKQFNRLQGRDLIWCLPFFDLLYYIYLNVFGLVGILIKTSRWK